MAKRKFNKIFVDDVDIFLLRNIFQSYKNKKACNTWMFAKEFISQKYSIDLKDVYNKNKLGGKYDEYKKEVDSIYRMISCRIKKYIGMGIVKVLNGNETHGLDLDYITFAKHKFSDGYHDCLLIRIS